MTKFRTTPITAAELTAEFMRLSAAPSPAAISSP